MNHFEKYCPWNDLCKQKGSCEYPVYLTCSLRLLKDDKNKTNHLDSFIDNFYLVEADIRSDGNESMTEDVFESLRAEGLI